MGKVSVTSVQKLFDQFVTEVFTERQEEARFVGRQARGNPEIGRESVAKNPASPFRSIAKAQRVARVAIKEQFVSFIC